MLDNFFTLVQSETCTYGVLTNMHGDIILEPYVWYTLHVHVRMCSHNLFGCCHNHEKKNVNKV